LMLMAPLYLNLMLSSREYSVVNKMLNLIRIKERPSQVTISVRKPFIRINALVEGEGNHG